MKHIAEIFQIGHAAFLRRVFTSVLLGVTVGLTPTLAFARDVSVPHSLAPDSPTAPLTLVALGNRVWLDINNDGTVSDGENGIPDVVLSLYRDSNASGVFDVGDTFVASQGTGPGGYYAFRDLEQSHTATNRYIVVVEGSNFCVGGALHELASSTGAVAGDSDLNNRDHGIDPATANCGVSVSGTAVTLLYGQEPIDDGDSANDTNMTIDFGFHKPLHTATATATTTPTPTSTKTATPTSTGTATATATATNTPTSTSTPTSTPTPTSTSTSTQTQIPTPTSTPTTAATATATPTATPQVAETPPPSPSPTITPPSVSSPTPTSTPSSTPIVEPPLLAGLGNYVWVDSDKDGLQSPLEQGVAGISVTLSVDGQVMSTTQTNLTGFYSFTDLLPGAYVVCFSLPSGYTFTVPGSDPASDQDSNANRDTGCAASVVLAPGEFNPTIDAGVHAAPTAITLQRFEVKSVIQAGQSRLQVEWQTGLESNTFGFYILRGRSAAINSAAQMNPELIPAQGRNAGASYTWMDPQASTDDGHSYYYWLREVELSGAQTDYGPVTLVTNKTVEQMQAQATVAPAVNSAGVAAGGVPMVVAAPNQGNQPGRLDTGVSVANTAGVANENSVAAQLASVVSVATVAPNSATSGSNTVVTESSTKATDTTGTSKVAVDSEREYTGGQLETPTRPTVEFHPATEPPALSTTEPQRSKMQIALGNQRQPASLNTQIDAKASVISPKQTDMRWLVGMVFAATGVVFLTFTLALMRRRMR